jgi:hypothetical protein
MILDSKIPQGPLEHKWENYKKKASSLILPTVKNWM